MPTEKATKTNPTTYGYARVSTREQNLDRQLDALRAFGLKDARIYQDKARGKDFERPAWKCLVARLREGDVLVVKSIDRLGRSYDDVIEVWRHVTKELNVDIVVLDMPLLDTRGPEKGVTGTLISDIVLQLLSYVAQMERESIRQPQTEGIASAKARGVKFGRPSKPKPRNWARTRRDFLAGHIMYKESAQRLGVCMATFDRWMAEDGWDSTVSAWCRCLVYLREYCSNMRVMAGARLLRLTFAQVEFMLMVLMKA